MATRKTTETPGVGRRKYLSETDIGGQNMRTDHKKLGVMFAVTALFFFLVGGRETLLVLLPGVLLSSVFGAASASQERRKYHAACIDCSR